MGKIPRMTAWLGGLGFHFIHAAFINSLKNETFNLEIQTFIILFVVLIKTRLFLLPKEEKFHEKFSLS